MKPPDPSALAAALQEWARVVGSANLISDDGSLRSARTATFATTANVTAIVRPGNRTEVQDCMRIANRFGVPVYPISSGKNWGYGSRAPIEDGVLLDLGRMNRILAFDEELAYVTIEPGVTQQQLHDFLSERHSRLWMDATGASPECSIIGNTMERGFGHTPMGDHCGNSCGYEVVLPSGDCIETGYSRFAEARTGALNRWGVGPSLDGLFSQSNFGIVTRMTVWLMPAPEYFEAFFFFQNDDRLGEIIEALRPLRLNGTLRSTIHIVNDYKVLTGTTQFPWTEPGLHPPLREDAMKALRKKLAVGRWNGSGGLYGTRAQVKDARRHLKRALAGKVDQLRFVNDRMIRMMGTLGPAFRMLTGWDVRRILSLLVPVYNLMKGVPTATTLSSTYWRKRSPAPAQMDPDRDGCGLLWCGPIVPSTGPDVEAVTKIASAVLLEHGFEPQMSVSLVTERSAICVTTISYDRHVPGDDEQALACYDALTRELVARGYPPYRLTVRSMHHAAGPSSYDSALAALKATLDPNDILAPGRYDGGPSRASTRAAVQLVETQ
jgi:4-cresol dehydrogenase (hydroxylating)